MGFEGASVTIPFKLDALRAAAVQEPIAVGGRRRQHAAPPRGGAGRRPTPTSTAFSRRSRTLFGTQLAGARAAVLGAGGSARAVVAALRRAARR